MGNSFEEFAVLTNSWSALTVANIFVECDQSKFIGSNYEAIKPITIKFGEPKTAMSLWSEFM